MDERENDEAGIEVNEKTDNAENAIDEAENTIGDAENAIDECGKETDTSEQVDLMEKDTEVEEQMETLPIGDDVEIVRIDYGLQSVPYQVTGAWQEYAQMENYTKGCKWSPDGTCIVTNSEDRTLRIYNLPAQFYGQSDNDDEGREMTPVLKMKEAELIYDYCWYPKMHSNDPETCLLASCSTDNPIHVWDAFTGRIRHTLKTFNFAEETIPAYSLAFGRRGEKLYAGFNKLVKVFDFASCSSQCDNRPTNVKHQGQSGIISCLAVNPADDYMYAAGSYTKSIGIYSEPKGKLLYMLQGQVGGLTHLKFSPDGQRLYSGGRKDPEILCWDLRNPGEVMLSLQRRVATNQRMYFDLDPSGRYVVSGNQDGMISVWDTSSAPEDNDGKETTLNPILEYQGHNDAVNGISLHPTMAILASTSGQRKFSNVDSDDEEDTEDVSFDNSLRIWWAGIQTSEN